MQRRLDPATATAPHPRLLLTGFGPFPGIPVNASSMLVTEIAKRLGRAKTPVEVKVVQLPTEWKSGPALLQNELKTFAPDIALHFGVASDATCLRIETMAENARARMPDASGHVPRRVQISATQPSHLLSTFPADLIRQRLEGLGIRVELSTDAGRYLCNATLFRSLSLALKAKGAPMAGFVHIPSILADTEQAHSLHDFGWTQAVNGGLAIVETCLAQAPVASAPPMHSSWPSGRPT